MIRLVLIAVLALPACMRTNPRYCDADTPCRCDLECDLEARECVPAPDAGDAGSEHSHAH